MVTVRSVGTERRTYQHRMDASKSLGWRMLQAEKPTGGVDMRSRLEMLWKLAWEAVLYTKLSMIDGEFVTLVWRVQLCLKYHGVL